MMENDNENENNIGDDISTETEETAKTQETAKTEEENIEMPIIEIEKTQEMVDAEYFAPVAEKKRIVEEIFEWIEIFSSALVTVILLFTFILRLVTVQGSSMEYTLHGGEMPYGDKTPDNLIISNLFYTPKYGDIVVIQVPNPSFAKPIIKRVIATEGQVIDIDFEKWEVTIYENEEAYEKNEGKVLDEPYVNYEVGRYMESESIGGSLPMVIEPGKIFVMGDNRNHSSDSRDSRVGQVDMRNIVGRVLIRVFPFEKFGAVDHG